MKSETTDILKDLNLFLAEGEYLSLKCHSYKAVHVLGLKSRLLAHNVTAVNRCHSVLAAGPQ